MPPDIPDVYWVQNSTGIHTLGNVGIGTTTVDNQLVVKGNVDIDDVFITDYRGEWYIPVGYARTMDAQTGTGITGTGAFNVIGIGATRTTDAEIYNHCWDNYEAFDLDGDGIVSASDNWMLQRYMFGSTYAGDSLIGDISNVYAYNATRTTHEEIRRYLSKYDYIIDGSVSYTDTGTVLSGVTTSSSAIILDVGIGVTGPGISAGSTVTAIGVDSVTISQAVTQTETSATVYFGNGVLDIDGDKQVSALNDSKLVNRVFGAYEVTSDTPPRTKEGFENFDFSNESKLNPDDGGGAQFRGIRGVGIGTTVLATDDNYSLQVVGKSKLDGDLNISGVSTFDGSLTLKGNRDFLIKTVFDLPDGSILENEHFTVKDGDVFIREDLTVDGNTGIVVTYGDVIVGGGLSVADESKLKDLETHRGSDIKLNETLYITPDDNVQNWYIPVGYARTTSPQVGTAITDNTLPADTTGYLRTTDAQVYDYCWDNYEIFDLDGDGIVSPIDTQIFYRYYFGSAFHNASLTNNYDSLFSSNATRTDYTSIIGYIIKYAKQTQTASFNSGDTTIGITTGTNVPEVRPGIAVTGTGIPANTTVIEIGIGTMTLNHATTSTETGVTLTFGNGLHNIRGGPSIASNGEGLILSRIFGSAQAPGSPYTAVHYESYQYNNEILNPNDGGPAQFKRYQKVSIADTTSNAGGARYISTEAPSAGIGTEGDIWYDISATGDSTGTNGNIPIGGIIMWYGSVANIPTSWRLCDGQSYSTAIGTIATPDLRDKFVVGATGDTTDTTYPSLSPGADGGSADSSLVQHHHLVVNTTASNNDVSGTHPYISQSSTDGGYDLKGNADSASYIPNVGKTSSAGNSATNANLPPYYALAYIMRIL